MLPAYQVPEETVWGIAVHGGSGSWAFDSSGPHAADHIYRIPQQDGSEDDYYVCDSRQNPKVCALLGGNLRRACAENYDPISCNFCVDHGATLTCEVRGWSHRFQEWVKVPVYPRDLLGELYRGEWKDVLNRPLWATFTFPKAALRLQDAKELPDSFVDEVGPAKMIPEMPGARFGKVPEPWTA